MDSKVFNLDFGTSFSNIRDINPNFAIGKMRVAYAGRNRNRTDISKEVFERAIPTMFNCPVVVRYDRERNMFGGHDIEVVVSNDAIKVVNATTPIGIVPSGAQWCWETVTEADGQEREYLCAEVLFWKRQEAYEHLLELGSADQSMEVEFLDYHKDDDGYYVADNICFSAFCLLESVEPCFESASVELFAFKGEDEYKRQFALMLDDLREYTEEKGSEELEQDMNLERTDDLVEEIAEEVDSESEVNPEVEEADEAESEEFELSAITYRQKYEAVRAAISDLSVRNETESLEYFLSDFNDNFALVEKHSWGKNDNFQCDFGRFAYSFDEAELKAEIAGDFEKMYVSWLAEEEWENLKQERESAAQTKEEFETYRETHSAENSEVEELREYKRNKVEEERKFAVSSLLNEFGDLSDNEEFKQFVAGEEIGSMELSDIENRCFAIRGKSVATEQKAKSVKLPAISGYAHDEKGRLYGGLFEKFGYNQN